MLMKRNKSILSIVSGSLWDLPSPSSMTYFWNFGSTLGLCLVVQILSGVFLTFHYTSSSDSSFNSVVLIMREIWSGWVIRFLHMNGASLFFIFTYLHMFRGMYYSSFVHGKVWMSGVSILALLMGISFLGYVLPWGQMSYWGVAVITSLLTATPLIGDILTSWIWGGYSVDSPTLTRFYSFHFLTPFILAFLVVIHLFLLHQNGSSNSLGLDSNTDKIEFHPYFSVKDIMFILVVAGTFVALCTYFPYLMGDPVNNSPADPMNTPTHIQPEWYFLTSYSVLRSMPTKGLGVVALLFSVGVYGILPMYVMKFSSKFYLVRTVNFWMVVASFAFLMKIGSKPAVEPWVTAAKAGSTFYFMSIFSMGL